MKKILLFIGIVALTFTLSNASWWSFGDDDKDKTHMQDKKDKANAKCDAGKCGGAEDDKKNATPKEKDNKEKCGEGKCG